MGATFKSGCSTRRSLGTPAAKIRRNARPKHAVVIGPRVPKCKPYKLYIGKDWTKSPRDKKNTYSAKMNRSAELRPVGWTGLPLHVSPFLEQTQETGPQEPQCLLPIMTRETRYRVRDLSLGSPHVRHGINHHTDTPATTALSCRLFAVPCVHCSRPYPDPTGQ